MADQSQISPLNPEQEGDRPWIPRFPIPFPISESIQTLARELEVEKLAQLLQLLHGVVDALPPDRVYCQIGWSEVALRAALLRHPDRSAYLLGAFTGKEADQRESLRVRLEDLGLGPRVTVISEWPPTLPEGIGVLYVAVTQPENLLPTLEQTVAGLAKQALLLVNQGNSMLVRRAILTFLARHKQASLLVDLSQTGLSAATAEAGFLILSWNALLPRGMQIFSGRPAGATPELQALIHWQQQQANQLDKVRTEAVQNHVEGYLDRAEYGYQTVILHQPDNGELWLRLGMLHYLQNQYEQAIAALQQSLQLDTNNFLTHHILGLTWQQMHQIPAALAAYRRAVELNPSYLDSLTTLAQLLTEQGTWDEAETVCQQTLIYHPDNFASHLALGDIYLARKQAEPALKHYRRALSLRKRDPEILQKIGRAYELAGDLASAYNYFGFSLYRQQSYAAAIEPLLKSQALQPFNSAYDYEVLSHCLALVNRMEEAIFYHQEAAKFSPEDAFMQIYASLMLPVFYETATELAAYRQRYQGALESLADQVEVAIQQSKSIAIRAIHGLINFALSFQGQNDRPITEIYGRLLHFSMKGTYPAWVTDLPMPSLPASGKIRIGYIAKNIGNNSMTRWATGWVKNHDRSQFEIYAYNLSGHPDSKTEHFRFITDVFYNLPTVEDACQQIRADQLHILVFLALGTDAIVNQVAALRLAPVQCSAWGHPVTSGIPTVDYFLSGDLMEPENAQEHYSETLIRLPNIGISYPKPVIPPVSKTRVDFGLPEDAVLYLCCQLIGKYLPQHDYILPEIARRVPQAKFVLVIRVFNDQTATEVNQQFQERLKKAFAIAGLNLADHCIFIDRQTWEGYTSLLRCVDVFLDTIAFSGGHTSFDAIACNLPIVTCAGELMRGRQSSGMLTLLGVPETIAQNEAEYIEIATRLGLDPAWRRLIAQRMSQNHDRLFDDTACVVGLEAFYRQVVQERLNLAAAHQKQ